MNVVESTDPYCLRAGETAALLTGHPWRRFAVLGDSVAEGHGDPVEGYSTLFWCARIAAELGVPDYLNLGRHGLKAADVLATQLDAALEFRPDLALVVCGGNDAFLRGYDPDAVDAALETMIVALQGAGADVITVSMFDISHSPKVPAWLRPGLKERNQTLADHTDALAAKLGTLHIRLWDHPLVADLSLYSEDGLHGNARCAAIAAAEGVRRLGAELARRRG
ncbi:SGNH/GDSL hydrolase family protein [Longispora sp. K20-0274]|uniref:SGNH/GDSL hydrolase family protein n=1 Tax=Longispora sp. K20-0274 TaxID=3088255 RepID=UPI00399B6318